MEIEARAILVARKRATSPCRGQEMGFLPPREEASRAPEASFRTESGINHLIQGIWRYPATNRLLFEAGMSLGVLTGP